MEGFNSIQEPYDNLRKKRLGIPREMELTDKTELPGKKVKRKGKAYRRDERTREKVKAEKRRAV